MSSSLLFLTCPPRVVTPLVEEVTTQLEAEQSAAKIVKYGVLCKGQDGFVIIAVAYPDGFATKFFDYLKHEEDITGYVMLTSDICSGAEMEVHHDDTHE